MNKKLMPLHELPIGSIGIVKAITAKGHSRRRILDLGIIVDTTIESLMKSPAGDPIAYEIRGAVIALRLKESSNIFVLSLK